FSDPGTHESLPQPITPPSLVSPLDGATHVETNSDVQWLPVFDDPTVNGGELFIQEAGDGSSDQGGPAALDPNLTADQVAGGQYGPLNLKPGAGYNAALDFGNFYNQTNDDAISYSFGKFVETTFGFTTRDLPKELFAHLTSAYIDEGAKAHSDGNGSLYQFTA